MSSKKLLLLITFVFILALTTACGEPLEDMNVPVETNDMFETEPVEPEEP